MALLYTFLIIAAFVALGCYVLAKLFFLYLDEYTDEYFKNDNHGNNP